MWCVCRQERQEGILLDRAVICSHRLSIQTSETTVVSDTVWPQVAMQVLTGGCSPSLGEKVVVGLKMGP